MHLGTLISNPGAMSFSSCSVHGSTIWTKWQDWLHLRKHAAYAEWTHSVKATLGLLSWSIRVFCRKINSRKMRNQCGWSMMIIMVNISEHFTFYPFSLCIKRFACRSTCVARSVEHQIFSLGSDHGPRVMRWSPILNLLSVGNLLEIPSLYVHPPTLTFSLK